MAAELSRVEKIFNDALEIVAPDERAQFLARACGDDAELRQRVEALLAAHERTEDVLRLPGSERTLQRPPVLSEGPGTTIGRYKLLEQIGEGGFGIVYMAEQHHPVRRKVALKVIKFGMDTKQVIARFEAERQALALMEHENIAKVLDAGATDSGRPYFVMELVHGVPITEYCDRNQLPSRQRLELFVQVCRAVQHAHTKGIIHRDIKPTNVLVTLHEGVAVPKVIDFGVAKATGQQLTEKTLFTNFAQMVGTPLYMSPEQAEMTGIDVDTRSDIYSLGVLLYELLTGTTPVDKERLKQAALDEVRRIIREEDPPRPSTRLSTMGEQARSISAARRKIDPKRLGQLVRGELDWIVMKALDKQRNRRYETANAFAHDIERFLNDEIVLARPPSRLYRFRKLVRRNRLIFAASAAVGAALLIGAILSTALAIRLKHTADAVRAEQSRTAVALAETRRQKEAAEAASAEAKAVNAFLTGDIIGAASPEVQRGRKLTVEEAVQSAAARVGERFKDRPLIEAGVRYALAQTLLALGRLDQAAAQARTALDLRRRLLGDDDARTLRALTVMGMVLEVQGKLSEAEPVMREALERHRRVLGDNHPDTIGSISRLGVLLQMRGKLPEAESLQREGMERSRRVLGDDHPSTLNSISVMGRLLQDQGKLSEAEPLYREALERKREVLGDDNPDTLGSINSMGRLLKEQGKFAEAEPLLREALERSRRILGDDHINTLTVINEMGNLLYKQGKLSEAEPLYRDALERKRRVLGDNHPSTLNSINNMGLLLKAEGKLAEAEPLLREAAGSVGNLRAQEAGSPENVELAIQQAKELKLERSSALDLLTCGEYFLLAGDDQKAVETIHKAIAAGGSQPFYQKSLGWALLRRGEGEKAHKALSAAMTENSPTTRAATTQSASSQPATRFSDDVDRWTAAYLLGAASQDEYLKRWEADYPSLVWFYIGEKLDISGDRLAALAAYRKSANQSSHHRTTNWSAYRIKQITGKYDRVTTTPTTISSFPAPAAYPAGDVGKR